MPRCLSWYNKYKRYHFDQSTKKWKARIGLSGKRYILGTFNNEDDAIKARQEAERLYYRRGL